MNASVRSLAAAALLAAGLSAVVPGTADAQVMSHQDRGNLGSLAMVSQRLTLAPSVEAVDGVRANLASGLDAAWASFQVDHGAWSAHVDSRSGRLESAEGAGIPWIPGKGNRLAAADLAASGVKGPVNLAALEGIARRFVDANAALFGLSSKDLRLSSGRSGKPADYLWFIDFDVTRAGVPIEGARVVFRVNHGNLIQFGLENVPPAGVAMPAVKLTKEQAFEAASAYVGGFAPGEDRILDAGSLHLMATNEFDSRFAEGFAFGKGYGLASVWEVKFKRDGVAGTWRARVDATTGDVLELADVNEYARASGGVILTTPSAGDTVRAMPFANLSGGGFTNSGGLYNFTAANSSTLAGQYVKITDSCGAISQASNGVGDILFGSSTGTDCTTPGTGGAGNTRSARTQFYWLNRIREVGRGWLPSNTWLAGQLTAATNISVYCNAYWDGVKVNFFKAQAPCGNTGEIPGVSLHEYGHGLDSNDGNGSPPDNGTGETAGDFTAALALHTSCIGPGFLSSNCSAYGNACTSCTGVRDIDWAKHSRNTASTVANFTKTTCPQPSANNPNYVGPCGKDAIARGVTANKREGHCESYVSSEALWDLANRDLGAGTGVSWTIADRLWYLSRSTASAAFQCNTSGTTWTSDGCNTGSIFKVMRAVDDDNGNLADGTPHGGAIFAAMNRHGIACATDAGASTTFAGCASPSTPTLTLTPGSNSATVSWTSSGAGVVYDVFRNESGCNAGFTKVVNDSTGTSFTDSAVANGTTYFYQLVAHPTGNEACGGAPTTCLSVTPAAAPCTPPAAPTGLSATAASQTQINLSWTAVSGATEYHIYRSTTSGGPYTQVGTSTTTSFSNTGLTCNTGYFYVVRAANSATCESGNSAQATATTSACTGCTTQTLYTNTFETGTGLSNWTSGTFVSGGSTASWRGIQTCTAQGGTKIFRYGGSTSCTAAYTNNNFTFAKPNGATGIAVPAGATTTRLTFGHRYGWESGFDGGTLALSVDGTNYTFVPASAILSGGYNGTVSASCPPAGAAGTSIWTGSASAFGNVTVNLDAACNAVTGLTTGCAGRTLHIAFTSITDCSTTSSGWFLDNVTVQACF